MPRFRKKPVVVEAVQWHTGDAPIPGSDGTFLIPSGDQKKALGECGYAINTPEGPMPVRDGDWIITGMWYPCNSNIFEVTYEPVLLDGEPVTKEISLSCTPGFGHCLRFTLGCEVLNMNRAFVEKMIGWLRAWVDTGHLPDMPKPKYQEMEPTASDLP